MDKKYVFPKVDLKKQPRTNYDLSHTVRTSFAPCLSIPIMDIETIPTDSFRLKMQSLIESLPMVAPALGRWKARFKFYINPMSNVYGWMDNNERLTTEEWLKRECHYFWFQSSEVTGNPSELDEVPVGVQSSCLFNYLGLPLGFTGVDYVETAGGASLRPVPTSNQFNAEGLLTYFDIVRNYCVNNQEDRFPMVTVWSQNDGAFEANKAQPQIRYYSLSILDMWFKYLRMQPQGCNVLDPDSWDVSLPTSSLSDELLSFTDDLRISYRVPLGGLVCTPYLMDFNRGIMNARVGSLEARVLVDEDTMSFGVPQLQFKNKMQNLVNYLDLSGGRFGDVLSVVWRSNLKGGVDKPIFLGSRSAWIYMRDIIATATTGSADDSKASILGQQGGFAAGRTDKEKRAVCNFSFNEYGRFMCIFELIPDVDYSAGIDMQLLKLSFSDKYIPQYAQIGYQDVSNIELTAVPARRVQVLADAGNGDDVHATYVYRYYPDSNDNGAPYKVGKRIAWSEYMTKIDKVFGNFGQRGTFDYWVLLRRYVYNQEFENGNDRVETNFTTYAYPFLFNYLFVEQDLTAQNFRLQVYFDIKAKRPFPKRSMPRL